MNMYLTNFNIRHFDTAIEDWTLLRDGNEDLQDHLDYALANIEKFNVEQRLDLFDRLKRMEHTARPNAITQFFRKTFHAFFHSTPFTVECDRPKDGTITKISKLLNAIQTFETPDRLKKDFFILKEIKNSSVRKKYEDILRTHLNLSLPSNARTTDQDFQRAIEQGDVDLVIRYLVSGKVNPNGPIPSDTWVGTHMYICLAARSGNLDVIRALVKAGADINSVWYDLRGVGHYPLTEAIKAGKTEAVQELLNLGARTDGSFWSGKHYGLQALSTAARAGHTESIRLLLDCGVPPDESYAWTDDPLPKAIVTAINHNQWQAAGLLYLSGATPPPELDSPALRNRLLAAGAEQVNADELQKFLSKHTKHGTAAALNIAARNNWTEAVKQLLANGADPNLQEVEEGPPLTPLAAAMKAENVSTAALLLPVTADRSWVSHHPNALSVLEQSLDNIQPPTPVIDPRLFPKNLKVQLEGGESQCSVLVLAREFPALASAIFALDLGLQEKLDLSGGQLTSQASLKPKEQVNSLPKVNKQLFDRVMSHLLGEIALTDEELSDPVMAKFLLEWCGPSFKPKNPVEHGRVTLDGLVMEPLPLQPCQNFGVLWDNHKGQAVGHDMVIQAEKDADGNDQIIPVHAGVLLASIEKGHALQTPLLGQAQDIKNLVYFLYNRKIDPLMHAEELRRCIDLAQKWGIASHLQAELGTHYLQLILPDVLEGRAEVGIERLIVGHIDFNRVKDTLRRLSLTKGEGVVTERMQKIASAVHHGHPPRLSIAACTSLPQSAWAPFWNMMETIWSHPSQSTSSG